ncbi:uncharacterized protein LOC18433920 [Amborella trichopoda]|uniref:Uncharacterized protein n=1 Tax=Amborella trichopoda TaxID=13333 RepID=W1PFA4_AMBTC|nr:uncharacterized protein LOC18433920 [Amborella trichopoda]ERN05735.1 hypothetical protein AMTR_s00006p00246720 [Amborella trichopoda]|eukprot:XP_006844060.1 uncharacterized protein LOC18433920 [Amborella trichopoda]
MAMEQQYFRDNSKGWLSEQSSPTSTSHPNGNVDRVLFKNLVEIVPLVESLMDRRPNSSFTRRSSLIYTRTPSRDSYTRKVVEPKGRKTVQATSKSRREPGDKGDNCDGGADEFVISSKGLVSDRDREELLLLRERVEELQKKLFEKDEILKSAESSLNQMNLVQVSLDELKHQVEEKDTFIRSVHLQLSDAKIKLADKQAVLEKLEWEVKTSNRKTEELRQHLDSMHNEVGTLMHIFETAEEKDSTVLIDDDDWTIDDSLDLLPAMEPIDDNQLHAMEEARKAYVAALAVLRENPDESSLALAAHSRLELHRLLFPEKHLKTQYHDLCVTY